MNTTLHTLQLNADFAPMKVVRWQRAIELVLELGRPGEVYNAGGGRQANVSMLEAIAKIEKLTGKKANIIYNDTPRIGDHIWYVSDLGKFKSHYPEWDITYDIDATFDDLCANVRL